MPWDPSKAYRHTHKAKSPKAQRQWAHVANSELKKGLSEARAIRAANSVVARRKHMAGGGLMSPLGSLQGNPSMMRASMPKLGMGLARARMPRIPIADTMRNINQSMHGARVSLPKLRAKMGGSAKRLDEGGKVGLSVRAISVLKDALSHLANKDASSAAALLRSNPEAMAHPAVQQAAQSLRSSAGVAPAIRTIQGLVNADTERNVLPAVSTQARGGRV